GNTNRPEIVLNIIDAEAVRPNPNIMPETIRFEAYPDYEYRERFPITVSMAVSSEAISVRISATKQFKNLGADFEKLWHDQFNEHQKILMS
ncbi:MAG: hypothetical protein AAF934_12795, partial [Bacteroidota bacterium]